MKKIFLILVFLSFFNTAFGACLPPAPPGWGGWYPNSSGILGMVRDDASKLIC